MTLNLPKPIAAYFTADLTDREACCSSLQYNHVVKDEGHTYNGLAGIKE